jgi:hypothetical protein
VGKIEAAWNWQKWLEPLGLNLKGIAASQSVPDVGHSKRFVCRKDMPTLRLKLLPEWAEVVPPVHQCQEPTPMDVLMLSKEFWSSDALAHPPLLTFPSACLLKLGTPVPNERCLRNVLSPSQVSEFRKTATKVEAAPWCMDAAAAYLRQWCDQNVRRAFPQPEVLQFLSDPAEECRWQRDLLAIADVKQQDDTWLQYAPGAPAAIAVFPAARKRSLIGGLGEPMGKKGKGKTKKTGDEQQMRAPVSLPALSHLGDEPLPPLPDGNGMQDQAVPLAVPQKVVLGESGARLGCTKCRHSKIGCVQCRNPTYRARGPKRQVAARDL